MAGILSRNVLRLGTREVQPQHSSTGPIIDVTVLRQRAFWASP